MNGFDKRKQAKMNDILTAAFELFREYGIEKVKVTDIAKRANVSKVSIYNYFGSKEELAMAVYFRFMDKKAEVFQSYMRSNASFREKFQWMYTEKLASVDELMTDDSEGLTSNELLASPQVQSFLMSYAETKIKPLFIEFIEQGKREGEIDSDIPTETILLYVEALHGLLSSPISLKQRMDLGKLYFYGLKGK